MSIENKIAELINEEVNERVSDKLDDAYSWLAWDTLTIRFSLADPENTKTFKLKDDIFEKIEDAPTHYRESAEVLAQNLVDLATEIKKYYRKHDLK